MDEIKEDVDQMKDEYNKNDWFNAGKIAASIGQIALPVDGMEGESDEPSHCKDGYDLTNI